MNDLPVGRSVDETLRLVQAFQYTDSHGEVCPAGWRPGSDTVRTVCIQYKKKHIFKRNTILINRYYLSDCAKSKGKEQVFCQKQLDCETNYYMLNHLITTSNEIYYPLNSI